MASADPPLSFSTHSTPAHQMVVFPHCKINLGLRILGKRPDGFHNLETVFYPVYGLTDILEIIPNTTLSTNDFVCSGLHIQGDQANNLCLKAWHALQADYPHLPPVHIHLHKVIPMGAGLGGGSSDGMFALQLLNIKLRLQLDRQQLLRYAEKLGSDCAFFSHKKPCLGTGRGEILQPIELDLSPYQLVMINPGIHVNTAWAFKQLNTGWRPHEPEKPIAQIVHQPPATWRTDLTNDFEKPVFEAHPQLAAIKTALYQQQALYAAMSGSGSTIFGLFSKEQSPSFDFPADYFVKTLML
jgi:4-diphosphocytidyl-2-C-methyl-D-erythritol kinase